MTLTPLPSSVQALGHVSGGHFNPAVTCAMLLARNVSVVRALLYIIAQIIGGTLGSGILKVRLCVCVCVCVCVLLSNTLIR